LRRDASSVAKFNLGIVLDHRFVKEAGAVGLQVQEIVLFENRDSQREKKTVPPKR
jgi:hypothetical protein